MAVAAAPNGVEVVVFDGLRDLPHFDPDLEAEGEPEAVRIWRRAIAESDALIGSGELERKVVAITAAVPGPERGGRGLAALRDTLGAVSADLVGGEPIVRGPTFEAEVKNLVQRLVDRVRSVASRSLPPDGPDGLT